MSSTSVTIKPVKSKLNKALAVSVCAIAILIGQNADAAESSVDFGISAEGSYTDNRFLSTTNKQGVYIVNVRPTIELLLEEERSQTLFSAYGAYALSSDQLIQEDRFNYGASVTGTYQFEYSSLSLSGAYDHQSLFDTEFEDTGIFSNNASRNSGNASFGYIANLNETWDLRISDNINISDYTNQGFNNYWSNTAGVGVDIAINDRTALVQNFTYLRYDPENIMLEPLNSYSYLAGLRHDLSEDTVLTLTGGASYFDGSYRWSAIAEVNHELENNQLSLRAAREILPSGLGGLRQEEQIAFDSSYNYSASTDVGITASWRRSKQINNLFDIKNEFLGLSPWVSFEIMRDLRVRLRYQLRRQKLSFTNDWAISNSFFISLEY